MAKKNINIENMTPVEVWSLVYRGDLKYFPKGYFASTEKDEMMGSIVRHIIENIKHWSREEVLENFNNKFVKDYKLYGPLNGYFDKVIFNLLEVAYPGEYHPWELKFAPNRFWNEDTIVEATRWLIEEKLQWDIEDIKNNLTKITFIDNSLGGLMSDEAVFGSPYKALILTYGEDFIKPWELKCTPMSYWTDETAKLPLLWLVEEKGFTKQDLMYLTEESMIELGFYSAYTNVFNENFVNFLNNAFPNEYKKVFNEIYHIPSNTKRNITYKTNTTGNNGVIYNKNKKIYIAHYWNNGKEIHIGSYKELTDAVKARLDFEKSQL